MRASDAYAALEVLGRPVVTTSEAAVVWEAELSAATHTLSRLAQSGLVRRVRHGVWKVGPGSVDPLDVLAVLTQPYPSYVSLWSALFEHGMIEQIPRSIYAASLDRSRTVETDAGEFRIHHVHPDLFGGFEGQTGVRSGTALPEKALFDTVYLLSTQSGSVTLPELELPAEFKESEVLRWIERVPSARLRTIVSRNLRRLLGVSSRTGTD
jgi:predicted transcriptional regulator of viral defense system